MKHLGKIGACLAGVVIVVLFTHHFIKYDPVDRIVNVEAKNAETEAIIQQKDEEIARLVEENVRLQQELAEAELEVLKKQMLYEIMEKAPAPTMPEIGLTIPEIEFVPSAEDRIARELERLNNQIMSERMYQRSQDIMEMLFGE